MRSTYPARASQGRHSRMRITVTTEGREEVFPLDVSEELTLRNLKALLVMELGEDGGPEALLLIHNMAPMTDDGKTLGEYGVVEGDFIMATPFVGEVTTTDPPAPHQPLPVPVQPTPAPLGAAGSSGPPLPAINWGDISLPGTSGVAQPQPISQPRPPQQDPPRPNRDDPETIRQYFLDNPHQLALLQQRNQPLAQAVHDPQQFKLALEEQNRQKREAERHRIQMLAADPLDPKFQQRIAQTIQQQNIDENMEAALEHTPEIFSCVVMLYILCKVNGVPVKVLVDSGARSTIMSQRCAERCNIMRLVDRRFAGMAFGVGRQKIVGRVHLGQIQIGNDFLTSSFQVLEEAAEDMLLGLDMLRRHLCCIDLKHNVLRIGSTGSDAPFLTEADLHEKEEMEVQEAAKGMEEEDAEMAKAVAKSEEEFEQRVRDLSQSTSRELGHQSLPPSSSSSSSSFFRPSQPAPTQSAAAAEFPESSILRITSAGFSREEAVEELRKCSGNAQLALASLLAKSIKLPLP